MAVIALHSAATGLSALSTSLDVTANNLANVNTEGFKASRANFQDLLYQEKAQPGVENANGDQRPTGLYVGLGVRVSGTQLDFAQGSAINTGRPLDVLIEGEGFLQVRVEDTLSQDGVAYTRAGGLTINADGELVLANDNGRRLEPPIALPENRTGVQILDDGSVYAMVEGELEFVDRIQLAVFVNPAGLRQLGENLFAPSPASGDPQSGDPIEGGRGRIRQGFLEGSNVDPVVELVSLIRTQRAFEMNSQSIRAADEVLQTVGRLRSL
ncbi:MAG: flagellar basal-body rod protein FlgG [Phycisphaeraceae bacterium]|nr:flagellar basal-body rod protein FlgG [Phycisphaeraceae bacterium]